MSIQHVEHVFATLDGCSSAVQAFDQPAASTGGILRYRDTATDDRRKVIVRLTPDGLGLVDDIAVGHLDVERQILSVLGDRERAAPVGTLRKLLLGFGDRPA